MKAAIVAGGTIDRDFVLDYMKKENYQVTLAADRGLEFFYANHLTPDIIVGDFDSVDPLALEFYQKEGAEGKQSRIIPLNPMKDDTDTGHALLTALSMGCHQIHIFGATGSRLDHVLGNLQLLGYALRAGVDCAILDTSNKIRLIQKETVLNKQEQFGRYVSLIPYTPQVTGLTLEGFLYPLKNHVMGCFYREDAAPISGVSNEIVDDTAKIMLEDGILVLVESRDKGESV